MVYFLRAFDLWRVVGEVLVDGEGEVKRAALVHSLVRLDCQREIKDVVWVRKGHFHRVPERELLQV